MISGSVILDVGGLTLPLSAIPDISDREFRLKWNVDRTNGTLTTSKRLNLLDVVIMG